MITDQEFHAYMDRRNAQLELHRALMEGSEELAKTPNEKILFETAQALTRVIEIDSQLLSHIWENRNLRITINTEPN